MVATTGDVEPAFAWAYATTETETAEPSDNGWNVEYSHYDDGRGWSSWATETQGDWNPAKFVFATVPSLTASSIGTTTATLTVGGYSGAWYYKHTNTGATCDGPVAAGTSTKALTGLTAGTSYTYSAYSDSGCTTGNLLATAAEFTMPVSVSNLSETSDGRLFVGGAAGINNAWATSFSVPSGSTNYTLNSITAKFGAKTSGSPGDIAAKNLLRQQRQTGYGSRQPDADRPYRPGEHGRRVHLLRHRLRADGRQHLSPGVFSLQQSQRLWLAADGFEQPDQRPRHRQLDHR